MLLSDAELNEGSVWEAAMFAAHHRLDNLVALVDVDGQQALGYTRDVLDLGSIEERFATFGWGRRSSTAMTTPRWHGHSRQPRNDAMPQVLVAMTTFGKGVSFMESRIEWHYLPLSDEQHGQALRELRGGEMRTAFVAELAELARETSGSSCSPATSASRCSSRSRRAFRTASTTAVSPSRI